MIRIPNRVKEGGPIADVRRTLNQVIEALQATQPIQTPTVQIERTTRGTVIRAKAGATTTSDTTAPRWG
jgi:hypothetical protein